MNYLEEVKQAEEDLEHIRAFEAGEVEDTSFDEVPWDSVTEDWKADTAKVIAKGYIDADEIAKKIDMTHNYRAFHSDTRFFIEKLLMAKGVAFVRDPSEHIGGLKRAQAWGASMINYIRATLDAGANAPHIKPLVKKHGFDFEGHWPTEDARHFVEWLRGHVRKAKVTVAKVTGKSGAGYKFVMTPSFQELAKKAVQDVHKFNKNEKERKVANEKRWAKMAALRGEDLTPCKHNLPQSGMTITEEHKFTVDGLRDIYEAELAEKEKCDKERKKDDDDDDDNGELDEMFVIGSGGLEKPGGSELKLQVKTAYFIGHSSSPELVIVDRISGGMVSYHDPLSGKSSGTQEWVFRDLALKGMQTWLKTYSKYQPELAKTIRTLLAGKSVRKNGADFDRFKVIVQGSGTGDLWRAAEAYGSVGGFTDIPNKFEIVLDRKSLEGLKTDKRFKILSMKQESLQEPFGESLRMTFKKGDKVVSRSATFSGVVVGQSRDKSETEVKVIKFSGGIVGHGMKNDVVSWRTDDLMVVHETIDEAMASGKTSYDVPVPADTIKKAFVLIRKASEAARHHPKKSPAHNAPFVQLAKWLISQNLQHEPKIFNAFRKAAGADIHKVARMMNVPPLKAGTTTTPMIVTARGEEVEDLPESSEGEPDKSVGGRFVDGLLVMAGELG